MTSDEPLIFTSPDGGKTVYARKIGETVSHLYHVDPVWEKDKQLFERWARLKPVVYMADSDNTLKDALEKLEMLYALKKKET